MDQQKVSISHGNRKMGEIPSVSLPACITCNPDAPCFKDCYAVKIARLYKAANAAYNRNLNILERDPASYWAQVRTAASMAQYFRFHVSGDIPTIQAGWTRPLSLNSQSSRMVLWRMFMLCLDLILC